jgi:RNA polymerase sigma-70 factor (ECF subfamily)
MYAPKCPDLSKIIHPEDFFILLKETPKMARTYSSVVVAESDAMSHPDEFIPTRESLLSRLKDWGDQESWKDFYNTYRNLIRSAAIHVGLTEAEAEDVVQETVIAVAKKIPGYVYDPSKASFKTWLMRQTRWRIMGQLRKRMPIATPGPRPPASTSTRTATIDRVPDPAQSSLERFWEQEWENALLQAAVERVKRKADPAHYQIFDLCVLQKWPVSRVAGSLRINRARVYLAKHRIGKLIEKEVEYLKRKPI